MIHRNDHPSPHVHVINSEGEVLINLGDEDEGPSLSEIRGMRRRHVHRAIEIVEDHQANFLEAWRDIHG